MTVGTYFIQQLAVPTQRGIEVYSLDELGAERAMDVPLDQETGQRAKETIDLASDLLHQMRDYYVCHPRLAANMHRALLRAVAFQVCQDVGS